MRIFIFLHVLVMFGAVSLVVGQLAMVAAAARRGDVAALRGITSASRSLAKVIGPAFGLGIVFGFIAIFTNGFNPTAPWLLIAYVLTFLAAVLPAVGTGRWAQGVAIAAASSPLDAPSPELRAALGNRRLTAIVGIEMLLLVLLIADMVLKPFS